jgi:diguanylate cyclase (GGDEF)-like protein
MQRSRLKLEIAALIFLIALFASFGGAVYRYFTDTITNYLGQLASMTAQAAVSIVAERTADYLGINTEEDEGKPFYREMQTLFQRIKSGGTVRYIYTERQVSESQVEYVLDAEPIGSHDFSPVGSLDQMDELRSKAYAERRPVYGPLYNDPRWGLLITGYAPIVGPDTGEFFGLLGVDIDASTARAIYRKTGIIVGIMAMLGLVSAILLMHGLVGRLSVQLAMDVLTSTFNRRQLGSDIESIVKSVKGSKLGFAVLLLDLDHFKDVNDRYGHQAGDAALSAIAGELKRTLRAGDKVYRYGGEEFVVVMPGAEGNVALMVAERIRLSVSRLPIRLNCEDLPSMPACGPGGGGEAKADAIQLTVSIGVAAWDRDLDPADLIRRADEAMYEAKRAGRNQVKAWKEGPKKDEG